MRFEFADGSTYESSQVYCGVRLTIGQYAGPVTATATALGITSQFSLTGFTVPSISSGGIVGVGGSVPAVTNITPGSLFSIYGQNFVAPGTGRRVTARELVNGSLPPSLLGVCVSVRRCAERRYRFGVAVDLLVQRHPELRAAFQRPALAL